MSDFPYLTFCPVCSDGFPSYMEMKYHLERHREEVKENGTRCPCCREEMKPIITEISMACPNGHRHYMLKGRIPQTHNWKCQCCGTHWKELIGIRINSQPASTVFWSNIVEHEFGGIRNSDTYSGSIATICSRCNSMEPHLRERLGMDLPLSPEEIRDEIIKDDGVL